MPAHFTFYHVELYVYTHFTGSNLPCLGLY